MFQICHLQIFAPNYIHFYLLFSRVVTEITANHVNVKSMVCLITDGWSGSLDGISRLLPQVELNFLKI